MMNGRRRQSVARAGAPAFFGLAAALCLGGCVSLLPEADPPAPRYGVGDVEPGDLEAGGVGSGAPVVWSLSIEDPLSTRAIDTAKIAFVRNSEQYEYYAGGEWVDRAPRLLHRALVRSFENSGRILAVGGRDTQPMSDFVLQTDIRAFEADETGDARAAVADIYARLTNPRGRVFAARRFRERVPVDRDSAGSAAEALNDAATTLFAQIVDWSIAEGEAVHAQKTASEGRGR